MELNIPMIAQAASVIAAAGGVIFAVVTFRRTQKWQQLRFASEVIEKIYSDDTLLLAIRFLDWHDREVELPERLSYYGDEKRRFNHKISNMTAAMSIDNREYDKETGIYDLKIVYRSPQYMIYVEVFDRFFDYLSQVRSFVKEGLIDDGQLTPLIYYLGRLDALKIFSGYLERYELNDVAELIARFKNPRNKWVDHRRRLNLQQGDMR
jgi:hypothetical protein